MFPTQIVNGLLLRDQRVLMARRSATRRSYPGSWSFPGGHVEQGETPEQALQRELTEEIGIRATSWVFLRAFETERHDRKGTVMFRLYLVGKWEGKPVNIGTEHTRIGWFALDEARNLPGLTFPEYSEVLATLKEKGPMQ